MIRMYKNWNVVGEFHNIVVAISVVNNDAEKHIIWLDELLISSACDSSSVTRVVMMFLRFHFFGSFFVESDESDRFYITESITYS